MECDIMSRIEEEISALESIFNANEIIRSKEYGPTAGQFYAFIDNPVDMEIMYKSSQGEVTTLPKITYLPPIVLHYSLPDDYPANPKSPPRFTMTCHWLTREQLGKLCQRLDTLWEENQVEDDQGTEILFVWAQFLKNDTLSYLEIENKTLDISPIERVYNFKSRPRLNFTSKPPQVKQDIASDSIQVPRQDSAVQENDNQVCKDIEVMSKNLANAIRAGSALDHRAVLDISRHSSLADYLIEYDCDKSGADFKTRSHVCNICVLQNPGSRCHRFLPCRHWFCEECCRTYFTGKIAAGLVLHVTCPETDCRSEASFHLIKSLVSPDVFARYDSLLLDATLASLGDIVICPRPGCQYKVTRDGDDKLANCFQCQYSFCTECRRGYHGVNPCQFKSGDEQKLVKQYSEGTAEERSALEKRFSKKRMEALVGDTLTSAWIDDNSKCCPQCKVAIEKSYGCNKIACWKCGTFFCWICSTRLDEYSPYLHYSQASSPCFQLLFHGVEELEIGEVMGDEQFEEMMEEDLQARLVGFQ